MLTPSNELSDREALAEFHELLRDCCADKPPPRLLAVRYQICRMALMAGVLKADLPGYVRQCMSSLRFREFIHLYDRDPVVRSKFVDNSLAGCWAKLEQQPPVRIDHARPNSSPNADFDDFMADRDLASRVVQFPLNARQERKLR